MSRTRGGRKYGGYLSSRPSSSSSSSLPRVSKILFEKFGADLSLDEDAQSRVATSYKRARNCRSYLRNDGMSFESKFRLMTDERRGFIFCRCTFSAIIIILSFLPWRREGLTTGLTTNTGMVKRALKVVSLP